MRAPFPRLAQAGSKPLRLVSGRKRIARASISLPAWEREYERERGLVGTSYETATVEEVTAAGGGYLRIVVDTAVTCTAQQYRSPGQFLYLKPWGDEDGRIEAAAFTAAPGGGALVAFCVRAGGAVGAAALAGEMLEVSEVMGAGFGAALGSEMFARKGRVVGACAAAFAAPVLLALRGETRPAEVLVVGGEDGPFAAQAREWAGRGRGRRVGFCADEGELGGRLAECLQGEAGVAVLLSGGRGVCGAVEEAVAARGEGGDVAVFAP